MSWYQNDIDVITSSACAGQQCSLKAHACQMPTTVLGLSKQTPILAHTLQQPAFLRCFTKIINFALSMRLLGASQLCLSHLPICVSSVVIQGHYTKHTPGYECTMFSGIARLCLATRNPPGAKLARVAPFKLFESIQWRLLLCYVGA
jgi:hypothetical protein